MATTVLLLLGLLGVARATIPEPCRGGPASWCRDMATAIQCHREPECWDLWSSLGLGDVATGNVTGGDTAGGDMARGDTVAPGRGMRCKLCTKILEKMKKMAGKEHNKAAVEAALNRGCQALGKGLARLCQRLVGKFRAKLGQELLQGHWPRRVCATLGLCHPRAVPRLSGDPAPTG